MMLRAEFPSTKPRAQNVPGISGERSLSNWSINVKLEAGRKRPAKSSASKACIGTQNSSWFPKLNKQINRRNRSLENSNHRLTENGALPGLSSEHQWNPLPCEVGAAVLRSPGVGFKDTSDDRSQFRFEVEGTKNKMRIRLGGLRVIQV